MTCYLTLEEAATYLKIPKAQLYKLCYEKRISYIRRARRLKFVVDELDEWMSAGRVEAKEVSK